MEFILPIMTNFLFASKIQAKNSRNNENGGLVIIISASSLNFIISLLLKSPSPSKYFHSKSFTSILPSPDLSRVNVNILPFFTVFFSSNWGSFTSKSVGW